VLSIEIEAHLGSHAVSLGHWLEIKAPCCLKSEETPGQEVERVAEFALNTKEISEVDQAFVVIEVPL